MKWTIIIIAALCLLLALMDCTTYDPERVGEMVGEIIEEERTK